MSGYQENIAIIGGGNWGTAVAKKIGQNLLERNGKENSPEGLVMWSYEEQVNGRPLTEIINETNENVKYLPGIKLPKNVRASPDLDECLKNKKILFFVIPHQFLKGTLKQMVGKVPSVTICVSLMKGIDSTNHQIKRFTTIIAEELGVKHVAAVMGANVATDVAHDHFAEATVACLDRVAAQSVAELLECDSFRTEITTDVSTVEWCGALKNIYAIAAGISDGMGLGSNAKAALLRQGLKEMTEFCQEFDQSGHFEVITFPYSILNLFYSFAEFHVDGDNPSFLWCC
jgi:glycerol-3-phosphate dehydrogenase (NAD+)